MSPPLKIERLTPNGEIHTADILSSIAKQLRRNMRLGPAQEGGNRRLAERIERLAKALEVQP